MSINLNFKNDLNLILKDQKPIISEKIEFVQSGVGTVEKKEIKSYLPPLNTRLNLSILPRSKILSRTATIQIETTIPKTWSWKDKKGISPVSTQGLCGSCWAFSTAQAISDTFYISKKVSINPQISIMYLLTCFPKCVEPPCDDLEKKSKYPLSYMCGGGNPADLVVWLSENGTSTDHCVDYSACMNNKICNGESTKHFGTSPYDINKTFPDCGCYISHDKHAKFYIEKGSIKNLSVSPDKKSLKTIINEVQLNQTLLKEHIYKIGPAIGCFHVLNNFMGNSKIAPIDSKFNTSKNEGGIYFDMVDYQKNIRIPKNEQIIGTNPEWIGGHAVSIIGWGSDKVDASLIDETILEDLNLPKSGLIDVPYWECRNSWGSRWGDNGYFKMAMYPFNQVSQFDVSILVNDTIETGGSIIFKPGNIDTNIKLPKNNGKFFNKDRKSFFESGFNSTTVNKDNNNNKLLYTIFFIIFLSSLFLIYNHFLKNKKYKNKKLKK